MGTLAQKLNRASELAFRGVARLGIPLRENDRRLKDIEGRHMGEECVIIGMGPSLKRTDLERFKRLKSFACNKIYLAFDETDWRPDYYGVIDILVARNNRETIEQADFGDKCQRLLPRLVVPEMGNTEDATIYFHNGSLPLELPAAERHFRTSTMDGLYTHGYTVLLDHLQLAYIMGFATVYLVGVDLSFLIPPSTNEECVSGEILKSEGEVNHFHPDYRKPGETWTMPKMEEQRLAFGYAADAFANDGRQLLNASRETKLDLVERVDFEEAFPLLEK